jgi:Flp pilus assembly secretin CpaC
MSVRISPLKPLIGILAGASALALVSTARAADLEIQLDQVRVVAFTAPVKTVFVGNPVIADITVIDPTHVFVLGKNFGTTNLIALDEMGREFLNQQITVLDRPGTFVTVQRGAAKSTLNCTSARCEAAPTPGDENAPFDALTGQMEKRETLNAKAAGSQ